MGATLRPEPGKRCIRNIYTVYWTHVTLLNLLASFGFITGKCRIQTSESALLKLFMAFTPFAMHITVVCRFLIPLRQVHTFSPINVSLATL